MEKIVSCNQLDVLYAHFYFNNKVRRAASTLGDCVLGETTAEGKEADIAL
jgi:quinolinate synthase